MAKLALKLRDQKRRRTVEKFKAKRAALHELLHDPRVSDEDKEAARVKLQKLPRDASPVRLRRRLPAGWRRWDPRTWTTATRIGRSSSPKGGA